jgi:hypothetical protein
VLNDAEDLRDHQGGAGTLDNAGADEGGDGRRQATGERRQRERAEAGEIEVAMPEQVAQARAGDEQHRVADDVAGHHQLQGGAGGVKAPPDGRQGDIDDRHVQQRHEHPACTQRRYCWGAMPWAALKT